MLLMRLLSGLKIVFHRGRDQCEGVVPPPWVGSHSPIALIWPAMGVSKKRIAYDVVADKAAEKAGILPEAMYVIIQVETGLKNTGRRYVRPWATNEPRKERSLLTHSEAWDLVALISSQCHSSFVVKCFYSKFNRHGNPLMSPKKVLNSSHNAGNVVRISNRSYAEFGKWWVVVDCFRSRKPSLARKYRCCYEKCRALLARPPLQKGLRQAAEVGSIKAARASQTWKRLSLQLWIVDGAKGISGSLVKTIGLGDLVLWHALDGSRGS